MKKRILCLVIVALWGVWPLAGQPANAGKPAKPQKVDIKTLPQKYRDWLDLVTYIIVQQEKDVFLALTNDLDRDIFIESFWKQRDPTPGTPANEFKEEHTRRFQYANEHYHRGSGRPGWMTDMGRIYITLGAPVSIERWEGTLGITPCVGWSYYGDVSKDLPGNFVLLFYQKIAGEYKLYNPAFDGPYELIQDKRGVDPFDYELLYDNLKQKAPTLLQAAFSIVPGEMNPDYSPTVRNNIILKSILESPKKNINPSYATHFLHYKGLVSTEYLTNYVETEADISLIPDLVSGVQFLNFSMVPRTISTAYYEPKDQYYCDFKVDVSLRVGESIIFQYSRDYPYYFKEGEAPRVRANGVSIEDSFPVVEGSFHLIILVQNPVGKEFSILERDIVVPGNSTAPHLEGPYLGYKVENYAQDVHIPYKIREKKLLVDPKNTFSTGDQTAYSLIVAGLEESLWKDGQVAVTVKGLRENAPIAKTMSFKLSDFPYHRALAIEEPLDIKNIAPDYYEIRFSLQDAAGHVLDEKSGTFVVSGDMAVPHPIVNTRGTPPAAQFLYTYMRAQQYDRLGRNDKAEQEYQKAYELNPAYKDRLVDYANFLVRVNKFDKALEIVENFKDASKLRFSYFLIKGKAQAGKGAYFDAIVNLLEGNKIYNSDTDLLNTLGLCYSKTNQKDKAVEVLKASLSLNPDQKDAKKLLEEIEKK